MKTILYFISGAFAIGLVAWYIKITRGHPEEENNSLEKDAGSDRLPKPPPVDPFVEGILRNIAGTLPSSKNRSIEAITDDLLQWHKTGVHPASLIGVLKVECAFVKKSATIVSSAVRVALTEGDKVKVVTLDRDIAWENVPQQIRSEFIRNGGKEHHFVICETSNTVPSASKT